MSDNAHTDPEATSDESRCSDVVGPQRGPASVNRIEAETRRVVTDLATLEREQ